MNEGVGVLPCWVGGRVLKAGDIGHIWLVCEEGQITSIC